MIRNAGGRAVDAIRTLAILQTIGAPGTIVVMHHTGKCSKEMHLSSFGTYCSRLRYDTLPRCRYQESIARDSSRGEFLYRVCQVWRDNGLVSLSKPCEEIRSDSLSASKIV